MSEEQDLIRRVRVGLGARSYDITIGAGIASDLARLISPCIKSPRVFVLTDETVAGFHLETVRQQVEGAGWTLHSYAIPAGEATLRARAGTDDLAGLTASLMKRGMTLVQMPTTLLAQVDSSVGGKTAINTRQGKNLVGAFYQPRAVIIDTDFLATLPQRERAAGYAEVVKYGLLGDEAFFDWLEVHGEKAMALEPEAISEAIARSCEAKAAIVAEDEREGGVRALLNLGHTFGHALEAENGYGPELLHGEGVACGMMLALLYSARLGLMTLQDAVRAEKVLSRAGLATRIPDLAGGPYPPARLIAHMRQDKKVRGNSVPLILARGIGHAFIQPDSDLADVEAFLTEATGH